MKRILAVFAATLAFAVVSSVRAVETNFIVLSQTKGQDPVVADDVLVKVLDFDGNVAAESAGDGTPQFDLAPGDYYVVVEQTSTGLFGQKQFEVGEEKEEEPIELLLSDEARATVEAPIVASDTIPKTDVKTDDCRQCAETVSPCEPICYSCEPICPPPNCLPCPGYGGCDWSFLGSIGGLIAVIVVDNPGETLPGSYIYKYR